MSNQCGKSIVAEISRELMSLIHLLNGPVLIDSSPDYFVYDKLIKNGYACCAYGHAFLSELGIKTLIDLVYLPFSAMDENLA